MGGTMRRAIVASLVLAVLAVPLPAAAGKPGSTAPACTTPATDLCTAYVAGRNRWAGGPIVYYVNPAGAPPGFVEAVQAAFDAWEWEHKSAQVEAAYPGDRSALDFTYGGTTARVPFKRDGVNVVGMTAASSCDHCAAASNTTSRGAIVESDIGFDPGPTGDAADVWSTDVSCPLTNCGAYDLHGALTHEIGHLIGLFHVTGEAGGELTMTPLSRRDDAFQRTLAAGDALGARALYPQR